MHHELAPLLYQKQIWIRNAQNPRLAAQSVCFSDRNTLHVELPKNHPQVSYGKGDECTIEFVGPEQRLLSFLGSVVVYSDHTDSIWVSFPERVALHEVKDPRMTRRSFCSLKAKLSTDPADAGGEMRLDVEVVNVSRTGLGAAIRAGEAVKASGESRPRRRHRPGEAPIRLKDFIKRGIGVRLAFDVPDLRSGSSLSPVEIQVEGVAAWTDLYTQLPDEQVLVVGVTLRKFLQPPNTAQDIYDRFREFLEKYASPCVVPL